MLTENLELNKSEIFSLLLMVRDQIKGNPLGAFLADTEGKLVDAHNAIQKSTSDASIEAQNDGEKASDLTPDQG